jgi:hypothetical protein
MWGLSVNVVVCLILILLLQTPGVAFKLEQLCEKLLKLKMALGNLS